MAPKLTKAEAVRWRRYHGNRVYAAEHALPEAHWRRASQVDLAALYYACAGPDALPIRWSNGTGGSAPERGSAAARNHPWVNLGRRIPLFTAVHEAAHTLCPVGTNHGQHFVDTYVHLLREHAPSGLTRALIARLRWQGFTIPEEAVPHPRAA